MINNNAFSDLQSVINNIVLQYRLTFQFLKNKLWFKILKVITIIVFIFPVLIITTVIVIGALLNLFIAYISGINLLWATTLGIMNIVCMALFVLCNFFEAKEFRSNFLTILSMQYGD